MIIIRFIDQIQHLYPDILAMTIWSGQQSYPDSFPKYNYYLNFIVMNAAKSITENALSMKAITWQKQSHSLFDYESNKNVTQDIFNFTLTHKYVYIYRNNQKCQIIVEEKEELEYKQSANQLLCCFLIKEENKTHFIQFYSITDIKAKQGELSARTNHSNTPPLVHKEEDIYLIVRSLKTQTNENKGYRLKNGQILKLGRVEYLVTSTNHSSEGVQNKAKFWMNTKKIIVVENEGIDLSKQECKYCYQGETEQTGRFLCTPCKCSGSCGLIHFTCLQKWNHSKVKKEVLNGTIQYNFEKFFCEVCQQQYPRYIQKNNVQYELLPIQKPTEDHIILEGISEKANNMSVIQNISAEGIKLGRGHDCQIRITDISVSRNHAKIQKKGSEYWVFDNKSKFGTLVKEQRLQFKLSKIKQGVQVGRTVLTFQKTKISQ